MSTITPTTKKSTTKEDSHDTINEHVDQNITHLTLSALSSALGDIRVMKLTVTNKSSPKYIPVTDLEEITKALQYISEFSNTNLTPESLTTHEQNFSYFILQQSPINMSAWNSLIDRRLGKIPQEAKIEASVQFDLVQAGIKAYDKSKAIPHKSTLSIPTVPKIHTTTPSI